MNKIFLHGRLVRDPELITTQNGIETCRFNVAVDRFAGNDKEKQVDFVPCRAWRQTAAFVEKYFKKGDGVIVEGSLQSYKGKEDRTMWTVQVYRVEFAEKRAGQTGGEAVENADSFTDYNDELPF